jgi:uncharacterized small protein (DUF1192 family)
MAFAPVGRISEATMSESKYQTIPSVPLSPENERWLIHYENYLRAYTASQSEIARLTAEVECVRYELETLDGSHKVLSHRIAAMGRENERLRAELMRYGDHAYDCTSRKYGFNGQCDCKWTMIAKALTHEQEGK